VSRICLVGLHDKLIARSAISVNSPGHLNLLRQALRSRGQIYTLNLL